MTLQLHPQPAPAQLLLLRPAGYGTLQTRSGPSADRRALVPACRANAIRHGACTLSTAVSGRMSRPLSALPMEAEDSLDVDFLGSPIPASVILPRHSELRDSQQYTVSDQRSREATGSVSGRPATIKSLPQHAQRPAAALVLNEVEPWLSSCLLCRMPIRRITCDAHRLLNPASLRMELDML